MPESLLGVIYFFAFDHWYSNSCANNAK